jgi:thiosulfate dehydrogenase [quinone] large subunit
MQITAPIHRFGVALLRVVVGIIFLWAGLEKAVGAGLGTWSAGGFLEFATAGSMGWPFVSGEIAEGTVFNPTHDFWVGVAQNQGAMAVIDYLVPLGQIGIGLSLILGLLTRFGAAMGALMMLFFFVAAWEFEFGIVNQHLTYAVVCAALAGVGAGKYWGLDGGLADSVPDWFRDWFMSGEPEAEARYAPAPA